MTTTTQELVDHSYHSSNHLILDAVQRLGISVRDLQRISELSPYLILDGHRSGMREDEAEYLGYIEGAKFSLRFATILKKLGGKQATFLIHTLRNYKTQGRMQSIFSAVKKIGEKFIRAAHAESIKLTYFGHDVHGDYSLAPIINAAELATRDGEFKLNYITNYNETWAITHLDELDPLPEINVVGRFTKGHYSGANIPTKHEKANFFYIQQASIDRNWSDEEIMLLILSLLKSYIVIDGAIGGKSYEDGEKEGIRQARQENWTGNYSLDYDPIRNPKQLISFDPRGPMMIQISA